LSYIQQNYTQPFYSGVWIDINFNDSIFGYVENASDNLYSTDTIDMSGINIRYWFNLLNNRDTILSKLKASIIGSNVLSSNDKLYSLTVIDLSIDLLNNDYSIDSGLIKIKNIETEILNEQWNLNNEGFSLYSIAYLKNSYLYWMSKYGSSGKKKSMSELMAINRTRVAANTVADYVVGTGTFLSATGASGGVGAAAGAWAGVKAGAAASGVVDWVGSLLDWW
jgi:hypothetical protein